MLYTNLVLAAAAATGGAAEAAPQQPDTLPTIYLGGPSCDAGAQQFIECNGPITMIQLDGTGSVGATSYNWEIRCAGGSVDDPTSPTPILSVDVMGQCFLECGGITLTVSDGQGGSESCKTAVIISDTTPPTLTCPPDVDLPAGSSTNPSDTGMPTVMDMCDPNPVVDMSDSVDVQGNVTTITRTWTTTDGCGNSVSCDQIITVTEDEPPVEGEAALDIKPGSCPNPVNVKSPGGVLPAGLLGSNGFDVNDVDLSSLMLSRTDGVGGAVAPVRTRYSDVGTPFDGEDCDCHTLKGDGVLDVSLKFKKADVVNALQLKGLPFKSFVEVQVTGQLNDGTPFSATDCIRIN